MYPSIRLPSRTAVALPDAPPRRRLVGVTGNVVALGFTSLFTDISSEMINAILPVYLTMVVGLSAARFGVFDGLYGAVASVTAIVSAMAADSLRRHKQVAGAGYATSALCKLGLVAAGGAILPVAGVLYTDRLGKGMRSSPRDALISLSSSPDTLGVAFGVHRALDTAGALLGPLVAFALLLWAPGSYPTLFFVSFLFAAVGVSILALFVRNVDRRTRTRVALRPQLRAVAALLRSVECRRIAAAGFLLGLFTVSDSMLYLTLQHRSDLAWRWFPLLSVGTAAAYLVLAVPLGRAADALGRRRVYLVGFALLLLTYALLLTGSGAFVVVLGALAMLGCYYACTDGVLAAIGAGSLPVGTRASGLALLTGAVAAGRMVSSFVYGAVWQAHGTRVALVVSGVGLCAAVATSARLLRRR